MKFFSLVGAAIVACAAASDSSRRRPPALKNIVQTAEDTPQLSSLVGALAKANLVGALSSDGPFTVFAPTNDAFKAIQDTVDGLTMQQLTEVLEYHVIVNVEAKSTDLSNNQKLQPLFFGHQLSVDLSNGVKIRGETNTVTVTTADVLCSNGVVHIVNAVLVPNSLRTIVDLAVASPMLSSLVGALQKANLVEALSGPGPFTVFAPTNAAFAAISSVVDGLTLDQLTEILEYHVVSGVAANAADLRNKQVLSPLFSDHKLTVNLPRHGGVQIIGETNTVNVVVADQGCSNGVIHIVDAVIVPRYLSIVETALAQPSLSTLVSALGTANLVDALSGPGPFTVFAPTNAAFAAISSLVDGLTTEQLTDLLKAHVLSSEIDVSQVSAQMWGPAKETLFEGHSVSFFKRFYKEDNRPRNAVFKVKSETTTAFVTVADVLCSNGIVHIVDTVLVPNVPLASIAVTAANWVGSGRNAVRLSSLVGALGQANLVDALSGEGPLTVFAPTDAAFGAISQIVGSLTMEQLAEILEYHVISGVAAKAADLTNGEVLQPLFAGHALTVELAGRNVNIKAEGNTVQVTMADRLCTNGVVHVVDAVLLPNIPLTTMNIVQTAQSVPDLSSLVGAVVSAGLVNTLSGPGPFTVFAPTNAAFDAISQVVAGLTTQQLVDVLENHVLSGAFQATDLTPGGFLLPLFKGHSLSVDLSKSCAGDGTYCRPCAGSGNFCEVKIMSETVSAMITIGDIKCTNGVVHVVDAVLVPNRLAVV